MATQRFSLPPAVVFKSGGDWEFQLQVLGYEHPGIAEEEYDANWLMVSLRARFPGGSWHATDPCLLTWELKRLATWLSALSDFYEPIPENTLEFHEPTLSFEVTGRGPETLTLRISFALDIRPVWTPGHTGRMEGWMELQLSSLDLQTAAAALLTQFQSFRPRGAPPLESSPQEYPAQEPPPPPPL